MSILKKMLVATSVAAAATAAATASPAYAAVIQQNCLGFRTPMCLYYHTAAYGFGAEFGSANNIYSFNPAYGTGNTYEFIAGTYGNAGANVTVWNEAGGAQDFDPTYSFAVYANHGYSGTAETIPPGAARSLTTTHNNDTSIKLLL